MCIAEQESTSPSLSISLSYTHLHTDTQTNIQITSGFQHRNATHIHSHTHAHRHTHSASVFCTGCYPHTNTLAFCTGLLHTDTQPLALCTGCYSHTHRHTQTNTNTHQKPLAVKYRHTNTRSVASCTGCYIHCHTHTCTQSCAFLDTKRGAVFPAGQLPGPAEQGAFESFQCVARSASSFLLALAGARVVHAGLAAFSGGQFGVRVLHAPDHRFSVDRKPEQQLLVPVLLRSPSHVHPQHAHVKL